MAELTGRLDRIEAEMRRLERELADLRRLVAAEEEQPEPPIPSLLPQAGDRREETVKLPPTPPQPEPLRMPRPRREVDVAALLLDARTLAWTGGVVTLLGVAFFFVLAAERGWIGPVARISLGAIASSLAFATGFELRRRFGDTYAALSAAGVGIAGGYMTLAASAMLYHQLSGAEALPVAAVIAAAAAFAAMRWGSQTLASLGLLGAMLAPAAIALQDHSTVVGAAFATLVLAPATVLAVRRRWQVLQVAALVVTAPQVLVLAWHGHPWSIVLVVACTLIYAGGGLALTLRSHLTRLAGWLLLASAMFSGGSVALLYSGTTEGLALLAVAASYAAVSVALYRRDRDTATVMWAIGIAAGGVAAADLASGATLTMVWAAEATVLAVLARRLRDVRVELGAIAWVALAVAHAWIVDAPPARLFVENTHAAHGLPSAAALAIALAAMAWLTREWLVRLGTTIAAGTIALYAASLGIVSIPTSWDWGHVAVSSLLGAVACGLAWRYRTSALAVFAADALLALLYDLPHLGDPQRWWVCAAVAVAGLAVAVAQPRLYEALPTLATGALFATVWVVGLLNGGEGYGLLGLAAVYATVAVALRRRRDFASALGVIAFAWSLASSLELLHGTWLVLAWAVAAAVLAVLARFEQRLEYPSLAFAACGAVYTLAFAALPTHLFEAERSPGAGVPSLLLVVAAIAVFVEVRPLLRARLAWAAGALGLYAASLSILELSERAGGSVPTAFQRGHTGVSALWAIAGAGLLVVGVRRTRRGVQLGGIGLFGLALAKLFLYDLANLSSITRAFSFLAVGAMLLAAGFTYQRFTGTRSP
jgi:hypothetical protein